MDALIVQEGGVSFADELERMGATVYRGMGRGGVPDGFGLPSIVREGVVLMSLESSSARNPQFDPGGAVGITPSNLYRSEVESRSLVPSSGPRLDVCRDYSALAYHFDGSPYTKSV